MLKLRAPAAALALFAVTASIAHPQQLPRKAGPWQIDTVQGKPILLSDYRGKVVVVAFILTTCPHCQKTIGILSKLQPEFAPRGLQVVASAIEENAKAAIPGFVKNYHPPFPVGYDDNPEKLLDFWQFPRVRGPMMPIVLLIDRQGNIRYQHEGHDEKFYGEQQEQNFRTEIGTLLKTK